MDEVDGTRFPIMSLPEEVRGRIYNFLDQTEMMNFRRVCRQWKEEVHTFYNYHLKLDENNPHLQDILDRQRITDCRTGYFLLTPPNGKKIFKNSHLIKSLNISEAPISPQNLHALLTECGKSLIRLEINLSRPLLMFEYSLNQFSFPNLKSLVVIVFPWWHSEVARLSPVLQAHVDQEVLMINRLVRDSNKPKLTNLSIDLNYQNPSQVDWYSSTILSTLANHFKTLSRISLEFKERKIEGWDRITFPSYQLGLENWARIRKVDHLNYLNIRHDYDDTADVGVIGLKWMAELAMTQKKLKRLFIDYHKLEWNVLQEICRNCFGSLVDIEVDFRQCRIKTLDASCLQDCKNLKTFFLRKRNVSEIQDNSYRICNFHLLSESVLFLKIDSISILTTELRVICSTGFKNLVQLLLYHCGLSDLYGVDWEVFQKMPLLPKLCILSVKDLRFSNSDEEGKFMAFSRSLIISPGRGFPFPGDSGLQPEPRKDALSLVRANLSGPFFRIR